MSVTCSSCQNSIEAPASGWAADVIRCGHCGASVQLASVATVQVTPTSRPLAMAGDETLTPGVQLGQYRIERLIGKGGMGAVYAAIHTMLERSVALKVLPPSLARDPEFVQRFKREAKALAHLSHPNIVAIHDMGVQGEIYYFVMELVEGVSLRQRVAARKLTPDEALRLIPQVCDALEYAHAQNIVHRDIKPENILIDRNGAVKITDFGLAKVVRGEACPTLTQTNVVMGTPDYMAPEQRDSMKAVDHRADIYSVGVVFYEMLTGELPIGRFDPPSRKVSVDLRVDEVVLKALDNEPSRRYQRASEMRMAMSQIVSFGPAMVEGVAPVGLCLTRALEVWRLNWGKLALASLISSLTGIVTMVPLPGDSVAIAFLVLAVVVVPLALTVPLHGGMALMYVAALEAPDRRVRLRYLFRGFSRVWPLFVQLAITGVCILIGIVFFVLPGLLLGARWMFSTLVIMDRGCGVFAALEDSWGRTGGATRWHYVGLYVFYLLIGAMPIYIPCVGWLISFFTAPIAGLVLAYAYIDARKHM